MLAKIILSILLVSLMPLSSLSEEDFGSFIGSVKVEWLQEAGIPDREMRLLEAFAYKDPEGKIWAAPMGAIINGASIPKALWSSVGDPYTGYYRRASVIHDHFCETKTEPWEKVHEMFYWAIRAGGVGEFKAKIMYHAVYRFAKRWKTVEVTETKTIVATAKDKPKSGESKTTVIRTYEMQAEWAEPYDENSLKAANEWIEKNNPSLAEIRALDNKTNPNTKEPPSKIMVPIKP